MKKIFFLIIVVIASCSSEEGANQELKGAAPLNDTLVFANKIDSILMQVISDSSSYIKRKAVYPPVHNGGDSLKVFLYLTKNNQPLLLRTPLLDDAGVDSGDDFFVFENNNLIAEIYFYNDKDLDISRIVNYYGKEKQFAYRLDFSQKKLEVLNNDFEFFKISAVRNVDYYMNGFERIKYTTCIISDTLPSLIIHDENVQLRKEADTTSSSVKTLKLGESVIYLKKGQRVGTTDNTYWINIKTTDNKKGWIVFDARKIKEYNDENMIQE